MIWLAVLSFVNLNIAAGNEMVTCTSIIKLQNVQRGVRLHSHEVKYGSGSGQQSVTGTYSYLFFGRGLRYDEIDLNRGPLIITTPI